MPLKLLKVRENYKKSCEIVLKLGNIFKALGTSVPKIDEIDS